MMDYHYIQTLKDLREDCDHWGSAERQEILRIVCALLDALIAQESLRIDGLEAYHGR